MVGYLLILGMGATGDIDVVPVTDSESKWFNETHGMERKMCEIRFTREERICQGWIEVLQFFSGERGSSLSGSSGESETRSVHLEFFETATWLIPVILHLGLPLAIYLAAQNTDHTS